MKVRYYIRVSGRVQGVGFRWFVRTTADQLGLSGWVSNREDGDVEMELQGPQEAVEHCLAQIKRGNQWIRVDDLQFHPLTPIEERGFQIRDNW